MITFFIPFYNEEKKCLNLFLKELTKFIKRVENKSNFFILIDDGSTDNTKILLEKYLSKFKNLKKNKILLLNNKNNYGVGYSFKKAINYCKTKKIFFLPSDNDLPLNKLLNLKIYKQLDLVMFPHANLEKYTTGRYFFSMLFRIIYGTTFGIKVNYIQAPCLYNIKKLKKYNFVSNRFSFLAEVNVKMLSTNISYAEQPLVYRNKSDLNRALSIKNFMEIIINFIRIFIEIKFLKRKLYSYKSKKYYI